MTILRNSYDGIIFLLAARTIEQKIMGSQTLFIFKLLGISAILSVAIKYAAPSLSIPPTSTNALIAVLLPTIVMTVTFLGRYAAARWQKIS